MHARRLAILPASLLAILPLVACSAPDGPEPARHSAPANCLLDLEAGMIRWTLPGETPGEAIAVDQLRARLEELCSRIPEDDAIELRRTLGQDILGPVASQLLEIKDWRFRAVAVQAMPGVLRMLPTLILPGEGNSPALLGHRISLGWPVALRVPLPRPDPGHSGPLLLAAPFTPDVDPATDDPDTLRRALLRATRSVRLIPRNETDDTTLRRALEESRPGLFWFRGMPGQQAGLHPAFGALPRIVCWSLPSRGDGQPPALVPTTFASSGTAPAAIVVSTHAIPETRLAALGRDFVDGIARGFSVGQALQRAQIRAAESGEGLATLAALVIVGDPAATSGLDQAPWTRRFGP